MWPQVFLCVLIVSTKSRYCQTCHFPEVTCVCAAVQPFASSITPIILQHPNEQGHTKNTARLIELVLPQTQVYIGERLEDFIELRESLVGKSCWLLYPDSRAMVYDVGADRLESSHTKSDNTINNLIEHPSWPTHLLLIDATWRKAQKMYALNPWLKQLPCVKLQAHETSQYLIRKHKNKQSLSTIESLMMCLFKREPKVADALNKLFVHFKDVKVSAMPESIQQKLLNTNKVDI